MNDLEKYFRQHANELRFQKFETDIGEIEIRGIGEKAIKYKKDGGEDEFAYIRTFDQTSINRDFLHIARAVIKSFDNELWNDTIRQRIEQQKLADGPFFAPLDGFCHLCGNQVFLRRDGIELVTGCPSCCWSYCD